MASRKRKLISIIIPVYNEEENIENVVSRVKNVFNTIKDYDYEILFTDNHSIDNTFKLINYLAKKNKKIKGIRFSKNFGYQKSIYTGYLLCSGDATIQLDADLQDPPELISDMIHNWENGYKVVYGVRRKRKEGFFINSLRKLFYRLINWLSEDELPVDVGDFRLVDREIIEKVLRKSEDSRPYIRGQIAAAGFKQIGFEYERNVREHGTSKFKIGQLLQLAFDGIVNHSIKPLRIASAIAVVLSFIIIFAVIIYLTCRLFFDVDWPAGFATTTVLLLLGMLFNALFLGILGEYVGRIYLQVKKRPFTIVEKSINIKDDFIAKRVLSL